MNYRVEHFCCSPRLLQNADEIHEIYTCIRNVKWQKSFSIVVDGRTFENQAGYNKALEIEFALFNWESQPKLCTDPRLIGDFKKNDIFIEVQFGNSSTLYRDYYKFHYGLTHNLLSLAVLIVPVNPKEFFPSRPASVSNMAEFDLASRCFRILPIPVPILLIGLLPEEAE